jgi:predicted nucleic acid-binding Zn ribbon protein
MTDIVERLRKCKHCGASIGHKPQKQNYCSKSCGAHASKNKRHGYSGTREHAAWLDLRNRCRNPGVHNYDRYGARGITVCERWNVFENFLADMGPRPGKGYSVERIDNDGNYEPSNCMWATKLEQNRNRRGVLTPEKVKLIKLAPPSASYRDISKQVGCSENAVYRVRKGRSFAEHHREAKP